MFLRIVRFAVLAVVVAAPLAALQGRNPAFAQHAAGNETTRIQTLPYYEYPSTDGYERTAERWDPAVTRLPSDETGLGRANTPAARNDTVSPCSWETSTTASACRVAPPNCSQTSCASCGRQGCCSCPVKPAPCIDCPRVSTLSPNFNVRVFGAAKLDMVFSEARTVGPGTPFFLATAPAPGFDQSVLNIHARQTTLGAALAGPQFGGLQSGGLILAMFYNSSVIDDQYGFLPLQAYGELKNDRWRLAAGLQFDVFNPLAPTVLPFSALCGSGNAGNAFRGQLRLERFLHWSNRSQGTLQFALSEPITSTIDPTFRRINEDNGWPNVEGRMALGIGQLEQVGTEMKRPFEVGVSGIIGQLRTSDILTRQVVADVWGAGVDCRWKMTRRLGVAGEVYTGQGLGTYNAAILQTVNIDLLTPASSTLDGIRSTGGWLETFFYWTPALHSHVGYGVDDPVNGDIGAGQRTFNSNIFANIIWDVNQTFRVAFEFAWRETEYKDLPLLDDLNKGAGFHTQLQWAF